MALPRQREANMVEARRMASLGYLRFLLGVSLFLLALMWFRFSVNVPTHHKLEIGDAYRIGVIPWSDAQGWVAGAEQIDRGESLSGMAARRPLYPLLLADLFAVIGDSYEAVIYVQIILGCLVIGLAYILLRSLADRIAVLLFLSFLTTWRVTMPSVLMTENLGVIFLVISFALIWKGYAQSDRTAICAGCFLLGLSQAVRPYSLICLATVPLSPLFVSGTKSGRIRASGCLLLCSFAGYAFQPVSVALFSEFGTVSNFALTAYGQIVGGQGWQAAYQDPLILEAMQQGQSPAFINALVYQRCAELLMADPMKCVQGIGKGFRWYFGTISDVYPKWHKTFWFMCILLLAIDRPPMLGDLWQRLKARPMIWLFLPLFLLGAGFFWTAFLVIGTITAVKRRQDEFHMFILLYWVGIILSLVFVGAEAERRVTISSDIFIFWLTAMGAHAFLNDTQKSLPIEARFHFKGMNKVWSLAAVALLVLIVCPWLIRFVERESAVADEITLDHGLMQLQSMSGSDDSILSMRDLAAVEQLWPEPSYETLQGRFAVLKYRFATRDCIFLFFQEGFPTNNFEFWPMAVTSPAIDRTLYVRNWTLFPHINPQQLAEYDGRDLWVAGRLVTRPRAWKYDTGYVLVASHVGQTNADGQVTWRALPES